MESYSKTRYQALRSMHRCVACGCPAEKSRCFKCMKDLERAVKKSQRKRLDAMQRRIKELEAIAYGML